jgi:Cep192 domain 4/Abnormal spindle-like microcephaly-assoc'd, ASPM-SPD-2-Hydin
MSLLVLVSSCGGVTRVFATVPSSVNFGNVAVGTTSTQTVTMTNSHQYNWTLTDVSVTGGWFEVSSLSLPLTLKPGLSTSFTIGFAPTTTGTLNGSISLTTNSPTNSPGAVSTISLTGTGVKLLLTLSPTSLNFPNTLVGHSTVLPVIITNTGTAAVTISSASVSGAGFTLSDLSLPLTLTARQSSSFSLTFAPTKTGTFSGTASLTSNATNSPTTESLSGPGGIGHSVSLTWRSSKSTGVIGYNVYRAVLWGAQSCGQNPRFAKITALPVSGISYTDRTVNAGQTYCYAATSVTSTKESGYSNQAVAKVPSP